MRFIISVLLIVLLAFIAGLFLPWWSIAIVAFLVALLIPQKNIISFLAGFSAIFIFWGLLSFWIDIRNDYLLTSRVARLFQMGSASFLLILITALIGGLVGGMGALCGSSLRPVSNHGK